MSGYGNETDETDEAPCELRQRAGWQDGRKDAGSGWSYGWEKDCRHGWKHDWQEFSRDNSQVYCQSAWWGNGWKDAGTSRDYAWGKSDRWGLEKADDDWPCAHHAEATPLSNDLWSHGAGWQDGSKDAGSGWSYGREKDYRHGWKHDWQEKADDNWRCPHHAEAAPLSNDLWRTWLDKFRTPWDSYCFFTSINLRNSDEIYGALAEKNETIVCHWRVGRNKNKNKFLDSHIVLGCKSCRVGIHFDLFSNDIQDEKYNNQVNQTILNFLDIDAGDGVHCTVETQKPGATLKRVVDPCAAG
jgi:hypothetical protein